MAKITGVEYDKSELLDIMEIVLNNAIDYWAEIIEVEYDDNDRAVKIVMEPADGEWGIFDKNDSRKLELVAWEIQFGINRIMQGMVKVNNETRGMIASGDVGAIDAGAADCIVQAVCFDKVVYG